MNRLNLAILPDRTDVGGYVYILGFDNGTVKVGSTSNPRDRVAALVGHAEGLGVTLVDYWISGAHEAHQATERRLLAAARGQAEAVRRQEYFTGVGFAALVSCAQKLPWGPPVAIRKRVQVAHANPAMDGAWLRRQRERIGLSKDQMAQTLSISAAYLHQLERGRRARVSPALFARICDAAGIEDRLEVLRAFGDAA
jgi:hypothetical protein